MYPKTVPHKTQVTKQQKKTQIITNYDSENNQPNLCQYKPIDIHIDQTQTTKPIHRSSKKNLPTTI